MVHLRLRTARALLQPGDVEPHQGIADRQLLERFIASGDEEAFTTLMQRHGRVAWGVCRRILGHEQDAEDAFQAAILVLARKAASIRKEEAVGSWLYSVAYRTAMKHSRSAARRHRYEKQAPNPQPPSPAATEAACRELQRILDAEVQRLADCYRVPFVLCCVEGMSKAEAARELGWKEGTVSGRLARARKQLQKRLARRGVVLSAVLTAGALAQHSAGATVPPELLATTVKTVLGSLAGKAAAVSPAVTALADSLLRTMAVTKLKAAFTTLMALFLLGAGSGLAAIHFANVWEEEAPQQTARSNGGVPAAAPVVNRKPVKSVWISLAFSPDGSKLVTSVARFGALGHLKIWKTATGEEVVDLVDPHGTRALEFSPDGQILACGDFSGAIRLRDPASGREQAMLPDNASGVNSLAFSPDGTLLASAGLDNMVRIWDLKARQVRSILRGHTDMVYSVAYFRHGKAIVTGAKDKTAIIWDVDSGKPRFTLKGHAAAVEMVAVSPDDKLVATASWDGAVRLWDPETGRETGALPVSARGAYAVAFSPDGKLLASASGDGVISFWVVNTDKFLHTLANHTDIVWALAFSRDGKLFASASTDMTANLWEMSDDTVLRQRATLKIKTPFADLVPALIVPIAVDPIGWGVLCAAPDVVLRWLYDAGVPPVRIAVPTRNAPGAGYIVNGADFVPPPVSDDFYYDFRGGKPLPPFFQQIGVDERTLIRPEEEGLRITLPQNRRRTDYAGVLLPYPLQGDFEITTGYEILHANRPEQGHGVGFSLYLTTATALRGGLGFERLSRSNEGEVFLSTRMTTTPDGNEQYHHNFHETTSKSGRLRLVRTGAEVSFFAADGAGEFRKVFVNHLGPEDLQTVRLAAYPGYAHNLVDLRIHDLRIRKLTAAESQAVVDRSIEPENGGPGAGLSLILVVSLFLILALARWLWIRHGRRAGIPSPARTLGNAATNQAYVSFSCAACGKGLKARGELAGKHVKCPQCGQAVRAGKAGASQP